MSDYTAVSFGTLEQGAADFQRTASSLASEVQQLESQLNTNLSEWDGAAKDAYQQAQAVWHSAIENMQQVVGTIGQVISEANETYQNTESRISASWQ